MDESTSEKDNRHSDLMFRKLHGGHAPEAEMP